MNEEGYSENWGNSETGVGEDEKVIERDMWVECIKFRWICKKCFRPHFEDENFEWEYVECDVCGFTYKVIDPR